MRIALGIEYDGTNFCGWQRQPTVRTIQQEVESALSRVANHEVAVVCAGRTDTGVHAINQVIHFDTTAARDNYAWMMGANTYLPKDIRVTWCQLVDDQFHARFSATARHYRYMLLNSRVVPGIFRHYLAWHRSPLDEQPMLLASRCLLGEHDFSSFRGAECQSTTPIRRVDAIEINRHGEMIVIDIIANAFLHHMVRNIVGGLLVVGEGREPVAWLNQVLLAQDRCVAGITASPNGLYLVRVVYPNYDLPKHDGQFIIE